MGGPWKARGFDPGAWRPPASRVAASDGGTDTARLVLAYVAAVVVAAGAGLLLLLARFA